MAVSEKALKSYLVDFGLNDKEISIYISLLQAGPSTIMDLSRKTSIKRSTTHNNVEELIKKGLVSQTNYGERRMVIAEDPEKLKFLLEQRKWDVQKLEKVMPDLVASIYEMVPQAKDNAKVDVKYYEGKVQVKYVYDLVLKSERVSSFVNSDKVAEVMPENFEIFSKGLKANKKIKMKEIIISNVDHFDFSTFDSAKYEYKIMKKAQGAGDSDIIIFDDSIALISIDHDNLTAIVIKSPTLSKSFMSIHELLWFMI